MDLDFTSVVVALATLFVGIWFGGRSDRFNRRADRRGERAELAQQIAEALKPVRTDIAGLRDANETAHAGHYGEHQGPRPAYRRSGTPFRCPRPAYRRSWNPVSMPSTNASTVWNPRFDALDRRIDGLEPRFDALDRRIDDLRGHFDTRFDEQGQRIKSIDRRTGGIEAHLRGRGASASARD